MTEPFARVVNTGRRDVLAIAVSIVIVAISPVIQFVWIVVLDGLGLDAGLPDTVFVLGPAATAGAVVAGFLATRYGRTRALAYGLVAFVASSVLVASLYATLPLYNL